MFLLRPDKQKDLYDIRMVIIISQICPKTSKNIFLQNIAPRATANPTDLSARNAEHLRQVTIRFTGRTARKAGKCAHDARLARNRKIGVHAYNASCHSERSEESQKIDRRANFLYDNAIIAGSSKGRTWDFESQYLGSIPSPAAIFVHAAEMLSG